MECSVDGCKHGAVARGLCAGHYGRLRRCGSVEANKPLRRDGRQPEDIAVNFWAKVKKGDGDSCWEWQGRKVAGYGVFDNQGHGQVAHRFAYEQLVGPIPEGLTLDHLCRNRACVNPQHLEPVTLRGNLHRGNGWSGRNVKKEHCPKGHPYNESNTYYPPAGGRKCIACQKAYRRAYRLASGK